eukprot:1143698-Pelagomonas_calceolata.AAC.8
MVGQTGKSWVTLTAVSPSCFWCMKKGKERKSKPAKKPCAFRRLLKARAWQIAAFFAGADYPLPPLHGARAWLASTSTFAPPKTYAPIQRLRSSHTDCTSLQSKGVCLRHHGLARPVRQQAGWHVAVTEKVGGVPGSSKRGAAALSQRSLRVREYARSFWTS